ncbi:MAG TPA: hypothetical protein VKF38_00980 [Anaerolineaceae bacterium]|nr:hypothetical protein [Anaerolineaceae bacterium]
MSPVDLIWTLIGFFLTLLVFSYIFGDNPVFRLVSYIFVGVIAGYGVILVFYQVLLPRLFFPLLSGSLDQKLLAGVGLILSLLLLTKLFPRLSNLGNISMAYLVGAGAAVAIGGALIGTLFGQTLGTFSLFDFQLGASQGRNPFIQILEGLIILVGIITTLAYFHFGTMNTPGQDPKRLPIIESLGRVGQGFIAITLGALFAGVFSASIAALIDRLGFILNVLSNVFPKIF